MVEGGPTRDRRAADGRKSEEGRPEGFHDGDVIDPKDAGGDQAVSCLAPMAAGIHAHRSPDRARNADEPFDPSQVGRHVAAIYLCLKLNF